MKRKVTILFLLVFLFVFLSVGCVEKESIKVVEAGEVNLIAYSTDGFGQHPITRIWVRGFIITIRGNTNINEGEKVIIQYYIDAETKEILYWMGVTFLGKGDSVGELLK